jgi:hypothetical protein
MSDDARLAAIENAIQKLSGSEKGVLTDTPTPGPQRLTGIDLDAAVAIVGDGVTAIGAPLTAKELKAIVTIGHAAYRRSMLAHLDNVEGSVKVKKAKRRGRPPGVKNAAPKANGEAPKRRGRPPKNRTVTYETPVAPAVAEVQ